MRSQPNPLSPIGLRCRYSQSYLLKMAPILDRYSPDLPLNIVIVSLRVQPCFQPRDVLLLLVQPLLQPLQLLRVRFLQRRQRRLQPVHVFHQLGDLGTKERLFRIWFVCFKKQVSDFGAKEGCSNFKLQKNNIASHYDITFWFLCLLFKIWMSDFGAKKSSIKLDSFAI